MSTPQQPTLTVTETHHPATSRALAGHTVWWVAQGESYHVYEDCPQLRACHERTPRSQEVDASVPLMHYCGWRDLCTTCRTKIKGDPEFPEVRV